MPKLSAPQELASIAPKLVEVSDEVLFADGGRPSGVTPRNPSKPVL